MTVRTNRFTPQALLSAPRRTPGYPNPDGSKALYSTSTYSFDTHKKTSELRCLKIESKESSLLTNADGVSDPTWVDNSTFLVLKSGPKSSTDVLVSNVDSKWDSAYSAATIPASASSLKIAPLAGDKLALVVVAQQDKHGNLYNEEERGQNYSTGRLYKTLFVRHWDEYTGPSQNALWYTVLDKHDGKWKGNGKWTNLLKGKTGLETPIRPFGGADNYDVSSQGIIFVSKDPELNPALNTQCRTYIAEIPDFTKEPTGFDDISLPGFEGAATSPVFSTDGSRAAYLSMKTNGYEADRNEIVVSLDVGTRKAGQLLSEQTVAKWDRSPSSVKFSPDGKSLFFVAEEDGHSKLWALAIDSNISGPTPRALTQHGSVSEFVPLPSGDLFVSGTSLVDNSWYKIVSPSVENATETWSQSLSKGGSTLGLSEKQVSSIWTPASNPKINEKVHSWVIRPSNYDSSKKYPLAFLIHGGPQGAWADSWSTRWNPAVYAEQGYIAIAPNPTGSTGYGQAFTDAIKGQWGGDPYFDLVNVFEYIEKHMPDVDTSKAIGLGASYGGYMVNWINGHDFGHKFKALVCHDGIFSSTGLLGTEELYFLFNDLGSLPFYHPKKPKDAQYNADAVKTWLANDPSQHLQKWNTPELVIHSSKDYRLAISEGLSAFNVLQARGIESQFLQFPDENHWVLKPENSLLWHKVVLNWANRFAGLPAFADEEEEGRGFFGGVMKKDAADAEASRASEQTLPAFGRPET
ncbi:alpha/beta-hydrolase [Myriangium duriaei CBS 260.36]|uniref:Dipeptidyl-peptidase V n=1 Tax=Myriangium duriaei CBS 260.36 TaxID=1168546 RepID=A0A9P4MFS8_9PEZI|nr:alpha/beta-hydrolase [Myriangium duriaei CBS 260.36]